MDQSYRALDAFLTRWPPTEGRALVVGSRRYDDKPDRRRIYANAFGVDMLDGPGVDLVHDLEDPLPPSAGKFDHIDCVSVLEHVKRPWKMAKTLESCLNRGGTILICVPFVWRLHAYPSDYWRMTAEALPILFPSIGWHERKYLVDGRKRKVVPGCVNEGGQWLARAELVAAGVRR